MLNIGKKLAQTLVSLTLLKLMLLIFFSALAMAAAYDVYAQGNYAAAVGCLLFPWFFLWVIQRRDALFYLFTIGGFSTLGGILVVAGLNFWLVAVLLAIPLSILVWRRE